MEFKNKTILIVSQQGWSDGIYISKHHYAIELAKRGNKVYFIGGPSDENLLKTGKITIKNTQFENLRVIEHELFYPLLIKFKFPALHHFLIRIHIRKMIKKINTKVDIVWSFDISNTIPLSAFDDSVFKIFMPVDEPLYPVALKAAESAKIILSVTNEIIDKYRQFHVPGFCINHGVSSVFLDNIPSFNRDKQIKVGLSGNFLRPEIDRAVLLKIINSNPEVKFHFFGKVIQNKKWDITALSFINTIIECPNVIIHGSLLPQVLAANLREVDAFLICYDIRKDQSKGTNYHKILEYLATGKIVISSNVSSYNDHPDLVIMNKSRENNDNLPAIFQQVINNLDHYNNIDLQEKRIRFAKSFRYDTQITKIEHLINHNKLN